MEIDGIMGIKRLDFLTSGFQIILVQLDSETAQAVNGMELTTLQWPTQGGMKQELQGDVHQGAAPEESIQRSRCNRPRHDLVINNLIRPVLSMLRLLRSKIPMATIPDNLITLLNQAEADLETAAASDAAVVTLKAASDAAVAATADGSTKALTDHQTASTSASAAIAAIKTYFGQP